MEGLSVPIEEIGQSVLVLLFGFKDTSADGARESPGHPASSLSRLGSSVAFFDAVLDVGIVIHFVVSGALGFKWATTVGGHSEEVTVKDLAHATSEVVSVFKSRSFVLVNCRRKPASAVVVRRVHPDLKKASGSGVHGLFGFHGYTIQPSGAA